MVAIAQTLAKHFTSFTDFELMLRVNIHDVVHFAIGGVMIGENSADAPEFFPIHSFVDKIWDEWQAKGNLYRFNEFFLAQNVTMTATNVMSVDFLNNEALPECVKVKYAQPSLGNWKGLIKDLKKMAGKAHFETLEANRERRMRGRRNRSL
jgi:hypothetical protein